MHTSTHLEVQADVMTQAALGQHALDGTLNHALGQALHTGGSMKAGATD